MRARKLFNPPRRIKLVEYVHTGGTLSGIPEYVSAHFTWERFAAIQIWIFVLFLVYTSIVELNAHLGNRELVKIFYHRAFITNEADAPVIRFRRSSGSAGESRKAPSIACGVRLIERTIAG